MSTLKSLFRCSCCSCRKQFSNNSKKDSRIHSAWLDKNPGPLELQIPDSWELSSPPTYKCFITTLYYKMDFFRDIFYSLAQIDIVFF